MVVWIIGKSGSGKSFFAKKIAKILNKKKKVFWLDGDEFRKYISYDIGYSINDRKINSKRIQDFCKFLEIKKYFVICSILSIFPDHQKKNKKIFKKYKQIYLKVENKILKKRNSKKVYSKKKNIVGTDIDFNKPYKSDLIIKNDFKNVNQKIKTILKTLNEIK